MWYVIQTISGDEEIVLTLCERLLDKALYSDLFIPRCIQKQKQRRAGEPSGEWRKVRKVLFPGYLFIDTEAVQLERLQLQLPVIRAQSEGHMMKLVGTGGTVVPISRPEQEYLSGILNEEHIVTFSTGYIVDNQIVVTDGPLCGKEAAITHIDRHKKIAHIEVSAFQKKHPARVGLEIVAKLTEENTQYATIRSGAFAGMTGRVVEYQEKREKVKMLVEVFGRLTPVTVGVGEVEMEEEEPGAER